MYFTGSIIYSHTEKLFLVDIKEGKGSNVLNNTSYLEVFLFNKIFMHKTFISSPKDKWKSLK